MNSETKNCQNCKKYFIIEPDDFAFYEKIDVPPPTFCVECREQRRIAFRNERALYKRKCELCGKEVVSRVSPDKKYPMYCRDIKQLCDSVGNPKLPEQDRSEHNALNDARWNKIAFDFLSAKGAA